MQKAILLVSSVVLLILFFLMVKDENGIKTGMIQKGTSYIEGLRLIHKKEGLQDWTMTARRADMTPKGDEAYLSGITMAFSGKGMTISADHGIYRMADRHLTVDGKVIAKGENFSVISEGAEFDSATGNLRTGGPVVIEAKKFQVTGRGMEAEDSAQTVRILNNVTAVFN